MKTKASASEGLAMAERSSADSLLELTAKIVSAYISSNVIAPDRVPSLIQSVHTLLASIDQPEPEAERPAPAVPVRKSVFADYIVCLEDGKKLKMLKRHLKTAYNLTPEAYRQRWGLPPDYPMVAPSYAKHRSNLAKQIGLGTRARGDGSA